MDCTPQALIESSKCFDCIPPGMQTAAQAMLACEWAEGGGTGGCDDPVVLDWLQRLADDFQPMPSQATISAVCDFCEALRLAGIMDKMLVVNPIIPDSFLAMRYPLIYQVGNGNSPWINSGFTSAELDNNGIQNIHAGVEYMDTGFSPSIHWGLDPSNGGMSIYQSDVTGAFAVNEVELGSSDVPVLQNSFYMSCWDPTIGNFSESCWTTPVGFVGPETPAFYSLNRTSTTRLDVYQANTAIPFHTVLTDLIDQSLRDPPVLSLYFMAVQNPTGAGSVSQKRVSFVSAHEPLTASEAQDFYEAVYWLRFDLGGGYI